AYAPLHQRYGKGLPQPTNIECRADGGDLRVASLHDERPRRIFGNIEGRFAILEEHGTMTIGKAHTQPCVCIEHDGRAISKCQDAALTDFGGKHRLALCVPDSAADHRRDTSCSRSGVQWPTPSPRWYGHA